MYLAYLIPLWLIILLLVPLSLWCLVLLVRRPRQRLAWLRRLLIVLLLAVIALRPATPLPGEQTERMNANVFFVVDRTGSMNAEDYNGSKPRLDGVKADMHQIMSLAKGSRYSIIGFDSTAAQQLPLTTDAGAVDAWIDTLRTEPTAYSHGSNVDRALPALVRAVSDAKRTDPESSVVVYVLTDGENTDGKAAQTFSSAAQFIDAGAVLGYGTAAGGAMKTEGGAKNGTYITDSSGAKGLSRIDEKTLKAMAQQLSVPYLHRTAPDESLRSTVQDLHLRPIPITRATEVPTFQDWYWIPAIPLAILMLWELGATTYRLPRRTERSDFTGQASERTGSRR